MINLLTQTKALSDGTRLRLLALLLNHELNVGEIVEILGLSQPRISNHLKILSDSRLIQSRRDGLRVFYRAAEKGHPGQLLKALRPLLEAEEELQNDLNKAEVLVSERRKQDKQFFDTIAGSWPELCRQLLGDFDLAAEIAARMPAAHTAADLGCGNGEFMGILLEKSRRVIGVDQSRGMLDLAAERISGDPRAELRIGSLEHLPMKDSEVDAALICLALHHLPAPEKGLAEALRVLSPGGTLLAVDFGKHELEELRASHGDRWLGIEKGRMRAWLGSLGFVEERVKCITLRKGLDLCFYTARKPGPQG